MYKFAEVNSGLLLRFIILCDRVPSRSAGKGKSDPFNSLCGTDSHNNNQEASLKPNFTWKAAELQKMIPLGLHNITFSAVGLETNIDLQKVSTPQRLISQKHRI